MKIIDLLNKIANGEVPKKIKYKNHTYEYYNGDYREFIDGNYDSNWLLANEIIDLCNLCDEIEILDNGDEEKGLPEKINVWYQYNGIDDKELTEIMLKEIKDKINEIIDYLEKQRKGE